MNCNHLSFLWKLLLTLAVVVLAVNFYKDIILHDRTDAYTRWLFPELMFSSLIVQIVSKRCQKKQPD